MTKSIQIKINHRRGVQRQQLTQHQPTQNGYAERRGGKSPRDAIFEACMLRFRPIMMTTMAAILGALPLMIGWGEGSELRHPLGITMVGGLIFSQALTLFTTPVIYLAFDALARRFEPERPVIDTAREARATGE